VMNRLVIVGPSPTGLRATDAARKTGFAADITLIGGERHLPYDRPAFQGVPRRYLTRCQSADSVLSWRRRIPRTLLLGQPATGLDVIRKVVHVGFRQAYYDALVIATGSQLRRLPGTEHMGSVYGLPTLEDSHGIRAALDAAARTVVEAKPTPLVRAAGVEMGAAIASLHERNGTHVVVRQGSCGS
jgi:NAD(P)H-nitrite reductase large subunit